MENLYEITEIKGKDYGCSAVKDLKKGTLILKEKPQLTDIRISHSMLSTILIKLKVQTKDYHSMNFINFKILPTIRALYKGGLISEIFSLWLISPKKRCQITLLSTIVPKEKLLRRVIWHLFWRIEPKRKTF